jgi:hypothetical protein
MNYISERLRKIYSRRIPFNLDQAEVELSQSNIVRQQELILHDLESQTMKLSKRNKEDLMWKFNDILRAYSRSLSPKGHLNNGNGAANSSNTRRSSRPKCIDFE